jgi:UDP-N-acetylglucosamine 1-carboxyvinyltransferase
MEALGATIEIDEGYIVATAPEGGLRGTRFDFRSRAWARPATWSWPRWLARGSPWSRTPRSSPRSRSGGILVAMGAQIEGVGTTGCRSRA